MRTSNRILLGTFLMILFILTGIHVALFAKYKSNDITTVGKLHNDRFDRFELPGVKKVAIRGLQNITIITADTASMEVEKDGYVNVHHEFANGILTITGDTTIAHPGQEAEHMKSSREVIIYLTKEQTINADFADLSIEGQKDASRAGSFILQLNETALHLGIENRKTEKDTGSFDKIEITKAKESSIDLSGNIEVRLMSLDLEKSSFEEESLHCDSLAITTDHSSSFKLTGKNMARTRFILKP